MSIDSTLSKTLKLSLTEPNTIIITDTTQRAVQDGYCVLILADAVISAITYETDSTSNVLTGFTLVAGLQFYLNKIKSITLTSGKVAIYQQGRN